MVMLETRDPDFRGQEKTTSYIGIQGAVSGSVLRIRYPRRCVATKGALEIEGILYMPRDIEIRLYPLNVLSLL